MSSFWIGETLMVTFGFAAWKSSATFWNALMPGSAFALCHQVNVTSLPPLSPPDDGELGAAAPDVADALVLSVAAGADVVGLLLEPLPELHAARPSAATATRLHAARPRRRDVR